MNRDDIIRMARETGCWETDTGELVTDEIQLGRFAALVSSAERDECLKFCDEVAEYFPSSGFVSSFIASKIRERGQA